MGRLAEALARDIAYNVGNKREFKLAARQVLKKLVAELHLPPESYDIRWNAGGVAVSGEATLHHERFYLQISQGSFEVLYRTCRGKRDFGGGPNKWCGAMLLDDRLDMFASMLDGLVGGGLFGVPAHPDLVDRKPNKNFVGEDPNEA